MVRCYYRGMSGVRSRERKRDIISIGQGCNISNLFSPTDGPEAIIVGSCIAGTETTKRGGE